MESVEKSSQDGNDPVLPLGIFAKEPVPGQVKTRLCPPLSGEQAARLYRVCLEETVAAMRPFGPVIFHAGDPAYFRDAFPGTSLHPQGDGDLGQRMSRALEFLLRSGSGGAALIGSDSPDLHPAMVKKAFAALRCSDVVTIPSTDGGYVLIGERRHHPRLFLDIPWSTGEVLAATRMKCRGEELDYREVGGWEDLDDLPSLQRLLRRSPDSRTASCARSILENLPSGAPGT